MPVFAVAVGYPDHLDLHANQLSARRVAVFFQPVGIDQARPVLIRTIENRAQEGVMVRHGELSFDRTMSTYGNLCSHIAISQALKAGARKDGRHVTRIVLAE